MWLFSQEAGDRVLGLLPPPPVGPAAGSAQVQAHPHDALHGLQQHQRAPLGTLVSCVKHMLAIASYEFNILLDIKT